MNQCPWGLPAPKPPGADGKKENIQQEKLYLFIGARFFDSALGSLGIRMLLSTQVDSPKFSSI